MANTAIFIVFRRFCLRVMVRDLYVTLFSPALELIHVLGDFNFRDIVWPDRLSKSGSSLSQTEGQILIDIMNDHGLEQSVNFPTRERNTLDLILTSLPGQFVDIHSPV